MLYQDVLMQDIDVTQWRNAQALLLDSAKEHPRIVVLHDHGTVRKVAHSDGMPVQAAPVRADDPYATAKALYEANADTVDFVAVFERAAFDAYFAAVQDSWDIHEDLDGFVQRTYAMLDVFSDGMVTYPGPARSTLGLQWRLGASRDQVIAAAREFVPPHSTVVLGVLEQDTLWASLVLTFGDAGSVTAVTTADPDEVPLTGSLPEVANTLVEWVNRTHGWCSLGLVLHRAAAESFLSASDKAAALRKAAADGALVLAPVPPRLAAALA